MLTGDVPGDEDTARWASELRDSDSGRSLTDPGGSGPVETPSYPRTSPGQRGAGRSLKDPSLPSAN